MQNLNTQSPAWLAVGKWIFAATVSLWASIPTAIHTLLVLMLIDYLTGLLRAIGDKTISSAVGMRGLLKKTCTVLLVITAHYLVRSLQLPFDFGATLATAFIINEVISIVENSADLGVPIPPALLELLLRAKKLTGREVPPAEIKQALECAADGDCVRIAQAKSFACHGKTAQCDASCGVVADSRK
jgi:toxin secretion/phage lysis holin